jgi:acyl-CoA reductase-like NAD-dependent aldehyde dehydrogenase/nicotinamidase-related amidase
MRPALLLVDLQNDYLAAPGLTPCRGILVERAAALLAGFRAASLPVFHTWTTVRRESDSRMPHWRRKQLWACVEGTAGHAPAPGLEPAAAEGVLHRSFYSPFVGDDFERALRSSGVDTLCIAGVHLHACVRASAVDAYQRGLEVWIAQDAVGSYDPLHADVTRRYLEDRVASFHPVEWLLDRVAPGRVAAADAEAPLRLPLAILNGEDRHGGAKGSIEHRSPRQRKELLWQVPVAGAEAVAAATRAAARAAREWCETSPAERIGACERLADLVEAEAPALARRLAIEVGKPIRDGRGEVAFGVALLREAARRAGRSLAGEPDEDGEPDEVGRDWEVRRRPHGVVGLVTPWNNPLAIPLGKLAPAVLYGNAAVWKPSPAGSGIALELVRLLPRAGFPPGLVDLVLGDQTTAEHLMSDAAVDAVSLTGSPAAGICAQAICARRGVPLQAELGGNNAAIVWSDCDLDAAAAQIADAAFGSAGQRCTANRRVVVEAACFDACLGRLREAAATIAWGDPLESDCRVGPLISEAARARVAAGVERAVAAGAIAWAPQADGPRAARLAEAGPYHPPTLVCPATADAEIVQEESFGPLLVVQRAEGWEQALELLNGVPQGLVAALFTASESRRASFLARARAGILKLGSATAGVGPEAAFGGWKASGVGPPEHGAGDREFYTRAQSVYRQGA